MYSSHDQTLNEIAAKVESAVRLSCEDGLALYGTDDLNALGKLADTVRRRRHGRTTYFNVNRHFNPTNVCYVDCKFCGFFRTPRQPDAYTHNIDDSLRMAGQALSEGATELHITGGLKNQRDHALRSYRIRGRPGRSHDSPARTAGQVTWFPMLHSAGVLSA